MSQAQKIEEATVTLYHTTQFYLDYTKLEVVCNR